MSKTDDMRALREARYAATRARPALRVVPSEGVEAEVTEAQPTAQKAPKTQKPTRRKLEPAAAVAEAPAAPQAGLCGHRAISGRTCTREAGHAAKSHRYS